MNLADLKNIDIENLQAWPLPVKIGVIGIVCAFILFLGYFLVIRSAYEEYTTAQTHEEELRTTYLNKKALALNLGAYKRQMEEMRRTFGTLLRQLPNKTEVENLLVDISQAALGRGLDFELIKADPEKAQQFYAEKTFQVKVTGRYHELSQFVSDVAALPRIVTLNDIDIISDAKGSRLTLSTLARTFRYLDADEVVDTGAPPKKPGAGI